MADNGLEVVAVAGLEAEAGQLVTGESEGTLVVLHALAPLEEEPLGIEHCHRATGLDLRRALGADDFLQETRDADSGSPCAEEHKPLRRELLASVLERGEDAGANDPRGSLDVVVEAGETVAIVVEEPNRVVLFEVLPLQQGVWVNGFDRADERLDESDVSVSSQPPLGIALVEGIVQQLLVVCPAVERYRQRQPRVQAGSGHIESELADGNAHPACSLVAESEDALVVGDDDEADSRLAGVAEHLRDAVDVVRGDPHAAGPPDDVAVLPTGTSHCRGVDDRRKLLEVIDEQPVEECLVAVLQRGETDVLLEVVPLAAEMFELRGRLVPRWSWSATATGRGVRTPFAPRR